jgi:hypothetical protein
VAKDSFGLAKKFIDIDAYNAAREKSPEIKRLNIPVLQALDVLLSGPKEAAVVRAGIGPGERNLLGGTAVRGLVDHGLIESWIGPTSKPRAGTSSVRFLKLTPKGRKAIKGIFVMVQ